MRAASAQERCAGRFDEARTAFEHGCEVAGRIESVRALHLLTTYWALLERGQNNAARAQELQGEAERMRDAIGNSLPEEYRAKFLGLAIG